MFNVNNDQTFNFNINAVTGTLRKSHPKSKMCIRELEKNMIIFDDNKPILSQYKKEVVILQVMLIGENRSIIEYVDKDDFYENGENNEKE